MTPLWAAQAKAALTPPEILRPDVEASALYALLCTHCHAGLSVCRHNRAEVQVSVNSVQVSINSTETDQGV